MALKTLSQSTQNANGPDIVSFESPEEAMVAVGREAISSSGLLKPATYFVQGGRGMLSTAMSMQEVVAFVRTDATPKGGNPLEHQNRLINPLHHKQITAYLVENANGGRYILPSITVNCQERTKLFIWDGPGSTKMGWVLIPWSAKITATDGMHRRIGIEDALKLLETLGEDGIAVTITFEKELRQIHQDFADCAKTLQINKSLKNAFDSRGFSMIVKDVIERCPILSGRIDMASTTLPKKDSPNIFLLGNIQDAITVLLMGEWASRAKISDLKDKVVKSHGSVEQATEKVVRFFDEFTEFNPQWSEIAKQQHLDDVTPLRAKYIHFSSTGLRALCIAGNSILNRQADGDTAPYVKRLAEINWAKEDTLWRGNLMNDRMEWNGNRTAVATAASKLKQAIQLPLSDQDQKNVGKKTT